MKDPVTVTQFRCPFPLFQLQYGCDLIRYVREGERDSKIENNQLKWLQNSQNELSIYFSSNTQK